MLLCLLIYFFIFWVSAHYNCRCFKVQHPLHLHNWPGISFVTKFSINYESQIFFVMISSFFFSNSLLLFCGCAHTCICMHAMHLTCICACWGLACGCSVLGQVVASPVAFIVTTWTEGRSRQRERGKWTDSSEYNMSPGTVVLWKLEAFLGIRPLWNVLSWFCLDK